MTNPRRLTVVQMMRGLLKSARDQGSHSRAVRDTAFLLILYSGALRLGETLSLMVGDVRFTEFGLELTLKRLKVDVEDWKRVPIGMGVHPDTCAVRALREWLAYAKISDGPLFREIHRDATVGPRGLLARAALRIVRSHAETAGVDRSTFSVHSLRAGALAARFKGLANSALMKRPRPDSNE